MSESKDEIRLKLRAEANFERNLKFKDHRYRTIGINSQGLQEQIKEKRREEEEERERERLESNYFILFFFFSYLILSFFLNSHIFYFFFSIFLAIS